MLQYIAQPNDKYSIAEQAQMAIEGGCKWVILRTADMPDSEIRELASELVPLCKETSTILTIENNMEMARELGLHGVYITPGSKYSPAEVREMFGPEAIIGVMVTEPSAAMPLQRIDIDYVSFPSSMGLGKISEYVSTLRNSDFALPIVAEGNFPIEKLEEVMATGVNGIAESDAIINTKDPVETTALVLEALKPTV